MLVVISIIVTLAAIVTPAVFAVQRRSLVVECSTHLQQLAAAVAVYQDDIAKGRGCPPQDGARFVAALWRSGVVREPRLFTCAAGGEHLDDGSLLDGAERDPVPAGLLSYAGRCNAPGSAGNIAAALRARIPPSRIAILCDRVWQTPGGWVTNHGDRICVAFLDGHVEVLMVDHDLGGAAKLRLGAGAPSILAGLSSD
jgi:prepilin-type processing-associated H-X9-DG protein